MKFDDYDLFKVCHMDGREWTDDELRDFLFYHNSILDYQTVYATDFSVGTDYRLELTDQYDRHINLGPPDFNIVWNKKKLLEILENGECE